MITRRTALHSVLGAAAFTNGRPTYTRAGTNSPLNGWKCTYYEGGIRIPFAVQWPGRCAGSNFAARRGNWKLIQIGEDKNRLYDLATDGENIKWQI